MPKTEVQRIVDDWIADNVQATGYEDEGDRKAAMALAKQFRSEMKAKHPSLTDKQIKEAVGDLTDYMGSAIRSANDEEVAWQVGKDRS